MAERKKIADNLYLIGDVYYYRKGSTEKRLGSFKDVDDAIEARDLFEQKRNVLGPESFNLRIKYVWPDYREERWKQAEGKIPGRKKLSFRTVKLEDYLWENHLKKFFGNKRFAEIDDVFWQKYVDRATVADLRNHRKLLGHFMKWAKKKGMCRVLPEFEIPQVKPRKRPILRPHEIQNLIQRSHGKAVLFIAQYLFMGMRRSEQQYQMWEDIDFENRVMFVRDETTRNRRGRPVPINSYVYDLLLQRKQEQEKAGIKSPWVTPMRWRPKDPINESGFDYSWRSTLRLCGWKVGEIEPHDLRATFEYYANKRSDFTDMQREKMAGASIKVQSQRYVTFDADDVRGLEESVSFEGLESTLKRKLLQAGSSEDHGKTMGNTPELRLVANGKLKKVRDVNG